MTLRRQPSTAVRPRIAPIESVAERDPVLQERRWLARQHERFACGWGRGWIWKEASGADTGNESRGKEKVDALLLAARCLEAEWRGGKAALIPGDPAFDALLLPPTRIAGTEDVGRALDRLLRAGHCLPECLVFDAATLVAEMAQNVCQHSGSVGCAAVTWTVSGEDAGLCVVILDLGIGMAAGLSHDLPSAREESAAGAADGQVPRSLAALGRGVRSAGRDDGRVRCRLEWGLQALLTPHRPVDGARGMGLRLSRALVARHRGAIHLRSGGLVVSVGADDQHLSSRCPRRFSAVPGTQICARLRIGRDAAALTGPAESR
jgi:hypothetical protein